GAWRDLLRTAERALSMARAEGLLLFEATNLAACAQACAMGGEEAAAADFLSQAAEAAARTPGTHPFRVGLYESTQAILAFCTGRYGEAMRFLEPCVAGALRTGARWPEILVRTLRCVVLGALQRDDEVEREAAMLVGDAAPVGNTERTLE